jgi:Rod binding domain-containing protein
MSGGVEGTASGLPAINQALEPKSVRDGSASTKKAYESALQFEDMLVEQLSQSLAQTGGVDAEGSQEGEGAQEGGTGAGDLSSLLGQALTGGVMRAGGLGMAAQMTRELEGLASAAQPSDAEAARAGAVAAPSSKASAR